MHDIIKAAVLGIIEGLTECLPVSSTGHMIVAMPLMGLNAERPPWNTFLYFIQIGAVLALMVYFAKPLLRAVLARPARKRAASQRPVKQPRKTGGILDHFLTKLVVATIPAAAVGLPLNHWIEQRLEKPVPVAAALIVGAGVMELIERRYRKPGVMPVEAITLRQAFLIGVAQCVSIIPGVSRSMTTIMSGLMVGLPPATAVQFSFYLAMPTLLGAGMLKLVKHRAGLGVADAPLLMTGFACAFCVTLLVVDGFMRYVQTRRLRPFAVYRAVLGAAVLAAGLAGRLGG